jgi:hypothetical protein
MRRHKVGFPLRFFDVLRGTEHVLVAHFPAPPLASDGLAELAAAGGSRIRTLGPR